MLRIRLSRFGKRDHPTYRIVVTEQRSKRDGKYTAILGSYDPTTKPKTITVNRDQYQTWIKKGAQPTSVVKHLVNQVSK